MACPAAEAGFARREPRDAGTQGSWKEGAHGGTTGSPVLHSMVATKRRFNPNLQRVRVMLAGKAQRAYVCTRCLKAGKVQKAL